MNLARREFRAAPCDDSEHYENRLLAALPPSDFRMLEPHLEKVDLARGRELGDVSAPLEFAWFPHDCVISVMTIMRGGGVAEMATIGREGVLGFTAVLGGGHSPGRSLVQIPGCASRMPFERLRVAAFESPSLRHHLLLYTEALLAQTFQVVACNALHDVEARCARWILMTQDRVHARSFGLTHEFLADMLGVQRSTVTLVTRALQQAGLIATRRGTMTVVDRDGLERVACECYEAIRSSYERLLPETYTPAPAQLDA